LNVDIDHIGEQQMPALHSRFAAATAALVLTMLLTVATVSVPTQAASVANGTVTLPVLA
jgi:hypothetical protein